MLVSTDLRLSVRIWTCQYGSELVGTDLSLSVRIWACQYGSEVVGTDLSLSVRIWACQYGSELVSTDLSVIDWPDWQRNWFSDWLVVYANHWSTYFIHQFQKSFSLSIACLRFVQQFIELFLHSLAAVVFDIKHFDNRHQHHGCAPNVINTNESIRLPQYHHKLCYE